MGKRKPSPGGLIPFSKLDDETVRRIVQGFACAETIAEIAVATGVSEKTCRSIVLALRYRLFRPAFNRWRVHSDIPLVQDLHGLEDVLALIYRFFAECYFNRRCYSNYDQGRRDTRVCRSCPIKRLPDMEGYIEAAVKQIDIIHDHYARLRIGSERGLSKLTVFLLRWAHTHVVGEACDETRKLDDGYKSPDFSDRGHLSVHALYEALIRDLEAEPLVRQQGPIGPIDARLGDLKRLDWYD